MFIFECLLNSMVACQALAQLACGELSSKEPTSSSERISKRVNFASNDVYLIPSRAEMMEESPRDHLWYDARSISEFRRTAFAEVKEFMQTSGIMNIRKAFSRLYQPDPLVYSDISSSNDSLTRGG